MVDRVFGFIQMIGKGDDKAEFHQFGRLNIDRSHGNPVAVAVGIVTQKKRGDQQENAKDIDPERKACDIFIFQEQDHRGAEKAERERANLHDHQFVGAESGGGGVDQQNADHAQRGNDRQKEPIDPFELVAQKQQYLFDKITAFLFQRFLFIL